MDIEPEALSEPLDILDGMLAERGRHRDEITVSVIPPVGGCDIDKIKRYRDAGADRVVIRSLSRHEDFRRCWPWWHRMLIQCHRL
jgi:hypothetical protein